MDYDAFIQSKRITVQPSGFEINHAALNDKLFPFQRDIVRWALRRGKAAYLLTIVTSGKTPMQLEWAHRCTCTLARTC